MINDTKVKENKFWQYISDQLGDKKKTRIVRTDAPDTADENYLGSYTNMDVVEKGKDLDDPETFKEMFWAAAKSGIDPTNFLNMMRQAQNKKAQYEEARNTDAYQLANMELRDVVTQYGGQWDDKKHYWQNYNDFRASLDDDVRAGFDEDAKVAMLRASNKRTADKPSVESIKGDVMRKYTANERLSPQEEKVLGTMIKDDSFEKALKIIQGDIKTRYLPIDEQMSQAEALAANMKNRKEKPKQDIAPQTKQGIDPNQIVRRGRTKDGRAVAKLKDGRNVYLD